MRAGRAGHGTDVARRLGLDEKAGYCSGAVPKTPHVPDMSTGTLGSAGKAPRNAAKRGSPPVSGIALQTPDIAGMDAGTNRFSAHLRRRCEEIGVDALAAALDRLESHCADEVMPSDATPNPGDEKAPADAGTGGTAVDPLDVPFEEFVA